MPRDRKQQVQMLQVTDDRCHPQTFSMGPAHTDRSEAASWHIRLSPNADAGRSQHSLHCTRIWGLASCPPPPLASLLRGSCTVSDDFQYFHTLTTPLWLLVLTVIVITFFFGLAFGPGIFVFEKK